MNDNVITTAAAEGTTAAAEGTKTGEQMLYDVIANEGSANSGEVADTAVTEEADEHDPSGEEDNDTDTDDNGVGDGGNDTAKQDDKTNAVYAKARR